MYNSCRTGRQLSSGSSHLLLFPPCVIRLTSVWSNLVGGLGPLPALPPHGRPTRSNDGGNAGASRIFPHPLSLLGVADPILAVAPSPSWSNAPQRGQNREAVPMQKAQAQLQGQQQCLMVGTCWGCTGTTGASQYHFSVPCAYTKNRCRLCPEQSWARPRGADSTRMAEKASYLQAGCQPSGTTDFFMLNIPHKAQRKGKANWRASSLFVPCTAIPAAWCGAERSQHNVTLQNFSCYTKSGDLFFFAGKFILLLNVFTHKLMCLCLICLDST